MSTHRRGATDDYSKGTARTRPSRKGVSGPLGALGTVAAALGIAGAILAVVATFSTIIKFVSDQNVELQTPPLSGYDRHSIALVVLGIFGLLMVAGAVRGARPAMAALGLAGAAVLVIAIAFDVPDINSRGPLTSLYEDAQASAGIGFYFETAAGALMLLAGASMLLLVPRRDRPAPKTREERRAERAGASSGAPQPHAADDGPSTDR